MTFLLNGPEAIFLGYNDTHQGYEEYHEQFTMELYQHAEGVEELCVHELHIYPSATFENTYSTNKPA